MRLRDAVAFGNTRNAVRSAYAQVSAVQDESYPDIFMGVAILFVELTENLGMDISEVIDWAKRYAKDDDKDEYHQFEIGALRSFIRKEFATKYTDLSPRAQQALAGMRQMTDEDRKHYFGG
jgi:hypothetical protein